MWNAGPACEAVEDSVGVPDVLWLPVPPAVSTPFDETVHCGCVPPGTGTADEARMVVVVESASAITVAPTDGVT